MGVETDDQRFLLEVKRPYEPSYPYVVWSVGLSIINFLSMLLSENLFPYYSVCSSLSRLVGRSVSHNFLKRQIQMLLSAGKIHLRPLSE